jgi:hypothetical protein
MLRQQGLDDGLVTKHQELNVGPARKCARSAGDDNRRPVVATHGV